MYNQLIAVLFLTRVFYHKLSHSQAVIINLQIELAFKLSHTL